jgi:hypothetical protein
MVRMLYGCPISANNQYPINIMNLLIGSDISANNYKYATLVQNILP